MSITHTSAVSATAETSGLFAETIGGIATIALTVIALSGTSTIFLIAAATIVFGAALLIEGSSIVSDYVGEASVHSGFGGLIAVFTAGITGIILGILALLGIHTYVLCAVAVIVFGGALLLGIGSMLNALAGTAAIVLGILAVAGSAMQPLALVALLVLGAAILATGNGVSKATTTMFWAPAEPRS